MCVCMYRERKRKRERERESERGAEHLWREGDDGDFGESESSRYYLAAFVLEEQ